MTDDQNPNQILTPDDLPTGRAGRAKPDYLDLITRRVKARARFEAKAPVCISPAEFDALREARANLQEAAQAVRELRQQHLLSPAAEGGSKRSTYAGRAPKQSPALQAAEEAVEAAAEAVAAAEEAALDKTVWLVLEGRSTEEIEKALGSGGSEAQRRRNREGLILDALIRVEDRDGDTIEGADRNTIAPLLPVLTSGELDLLYNKIADASEAPDFPTLRR